MFKILSCNMNTILLFLQLDNIFKPLPLLYIFMTMSQIEKYEVYVMGICVIYRSHDASSNHVWYILLTRVDNVRGIYRNRHIKKFGFSLSAFSRLLFIQFVFNV